MMTMGVATGEGMKGIASPPVIELEGIIRSSFETIFYHCLDEVCL